MTIVFQDLVIENKHLCKFFNITRVSVSDTLVKMCKFRRTLCVSQEANSRFGLPKWLRFGHIGEDCRANRNVRL